MATLKLTILVLFLGYASAFVPATRSRTDFALHMSAVVDAPVRSPESPDRVKQVRERFRQAAEDAAQAKGCADGDKGDEWWRQPLDEQYREVTEARPLRVLIAGGGVAGLVTAAACHARGMDVAIFEQASQYAPYGGPIQIQSNALRALERINRKVYDEIRREKMGECIPFRRNLKIVSNKLIKISLLNPKRQFQKIENVLNFSKAREDRCHQVYRQNT